jgi:hypothetical protein
VRLFFGSDGWNEETSAMSCVLELDTDLPKDELLDRLREHEPWAHRVDFSNGVSTAALARRSPFFVPDVV